MQTGTQMCLTHSQDAWHCHTGHGEMKERWRGSYNDDLRFFSGLLDSPLGVSPEFANVGLLARHIVSPRCGHILNMEKPALLSRRAFLSRPHFSVNLGAELGWLVHQTPNRTTR